MKSVAVTRSIVIGGHKINFTLEEPIWAGLKEIAQCDHQTLSKLVGKIDSERHIGNLSSALRMFVLDYFRTHEGSRVPSQDGHDNGPSMWPMVATSNEQLGEGGGQGATFTGLTAKKN
jgi:predicted DNA-binding ribbon-helix-helix protein